MLNTFVSSQPARLAIGRLSGFSLSVVAHAGLVTLMVAGSGRSEQLVSRLASVAQAERIAFVRPYEPENVRDAAVGGRRATRALRKVARLVAPDLSRVTSAIAVSLSAVSFTPDAVDDVDFAPLASRADDFGGVDRGALLGDGLARLFAGPERNGAYSVDVVERQAWPRRNNPVPRYPSALLHAGVEASFAAEFVIDSTGRVDAQTLSFPKSVHPLLMRAVKEALVRSRYFPAELAGVRVRQLARQQFSFVIAR